VVAAHGITSSHLGFGLVGAELGTDHLVVAADLRGRGGSRQLPGPYGMAAHAADLAAVVAHFGGGPAILVGHSMGGFAVAETARRYPGVVSRLVLIDGGALLQPPPGLTAEADEETVEAAMTQTVGPALGRLSTTFPSRAAYRDYWKAHPSFVDWSDTMARYADYDLVGQEPELRPACRLEAALRDARDQYAYPGAQPSPLPVPAVFLRAERGMLNQPDPFYPRGYASTWLPGVEERTVQGVNHYTIVLSPAGAAAVAMAVRG
jgi:pimeloyl-ACP methyl ester carboxylesterase